MSLTRPRRRTSTDSRELLFLTLLALVFVVFVLSVSTLVELPNNTPVVSYTSDISCRYPSGAQSNYDVPLVSYTSDIECGK